ncbi:MAG: nucleoside triphosphate pyrophosphohydrolase [Chlamydiota bacterium]
MSKLVRDFIPEIMRQKGLPVNMYVADNTEYGKRLVEKLLEEVKEYIQEESEEELADVLEVLDAIMKWKGFSKEKIEALRLKKQKERGSFNRRIVLVSGELNP